MKIEFPGVFSTGIVPEDRPDRLLVSDALAAWAMCRTGHTPPENFEKTMAEIARRLGFAVTPNMLRNHVKRTSDICGDCWGSGWTIQFKLVCTKCKGTGKVDEKSN